MPQKKCATRANAQNSQISRQKHQKNQDDIKDEFIQDHQRKDSDVMAQTVPPRIESTPLTSNTPTDLECILDESDLDSDQSTEIEEESELKKFTHTLQKAQITLLKTANKNRRGPYSKRSKETLQHHKQACNKLASKGFLSVDQYMTLRGIPVKGDQLTPKLDAGIKAITLEKDNIIKGFQEESEEGSDKVMALDHNACAYSNNNSTYKEKSNGSSPGTLHNDQLHLTHHMCMELEEMSENDTHMDFEETSRDDMCMDFKETSRGDACMDLEETSRDDAHIELEENTGDSDHDGTRDYERQYMSKDKTSFSNDKKTCTTSKYLDDLKDKAVLTCRNLT